MKIKKLLLKTTTLFIFALFLFSTQGFSKISSKELPEFYLGNKNAPITMYLFSSLACPHCKDHINMILKDSNIKSKYIDSGKVKLVYVAFPIFGDFDNDGIALAYESKNNEQFFKFAQLVFNNQQQWYNSSDHTATIIDFAKLAGFTSKQLEDFKQNKKHIIDLIIKDEKIYQKDFKIDGVPTTILIKSSQLKGKSTTLTNKTIAKSGIKIVGDTTADNLSAKIEQLLK